MFAVSSRRTFAEISRPAELYKKCHELSEQLAEDLKEQRIVVSLIAEKLLLIAPKSCNTNAVSQGRVS